jgi:hypothetical protein
MEEALGKSIVQALCGATHAATDAVAIEEILERAQPTLRLERTGARPGSYPLVASEPVVGAGRSTAGR